MARCAIIRLGEPRLREKSLPVEDPTAPEIHQLVQDLADTLAHWRAKTGYGRGIPRLKSGFCGA